MNLMVENVFGRYRRENDYVIRGNIKRITSGAKTHTINVQCKHFRNFNYVF